MIRRQILWVVVSLLLPSVSFSAALEPSSPPSWALLSGPLRYSHTAVYDSKRDRILMFGGTDGTVRNDTWALPLHANADWERIVTTGETPPPLKGHSAVYDPVRDRMIVLAGSGNADSSVWALSFAEGNRWTRLAQEGERPGVSANGRAMYDGRRDCLILLTGDTRSGIENLFYSYAFEGNAGGRWSKWEITGFNPLPLWGPVVEFDPVRDAIVLFGGAKVYRDPYFSRDEAKNETWALPLGDSLRWVELHPGGELPTPRFDALWAYDSRREAILVWGGTGDPWSKSNGPTWVLSLSDAPRWDRRSSSDSEPTPPWYTQAICDSRSDQVVVVAGLLDGTLSSDVYGLDLNHDRGWQTLDLGDRGPSARLSGAMIFDPSRQRFILYGGRDLYSQSSDASDLWEFDLRGQPRWKPLLAEGPAPPSRSRHTAIFDPETESMIVYGGLWSGANLGDVWSLSLRGQPRWTELHPVGVSPPARRGHQAIYDSHGRRMIIYGGSANFGPTSDVWALTFDPVPRWTQLFPQGTSPGDRIGHALVNDEKRHRAILYGGVYGIPSEPGDVWALDLDPSPRWEKLPDPPGGPSGQVSSHVAVFDPATEEMVVFGGSRAGHLENRTWALSLAATPVWRELVREGLRPAPRMAAAAALDPISDRMYVVGGEMEGASGEFEDTWALSLGSEANSPLAGLRPELASTRQEMRLVSSFSNPVRGSLSFSYSLAGHGDVTLQVIDAQGRLVRSFVDHEVSAGTHQASWNGKDEQGAAATPGIYFLRLIAGSNSETKKFVFLGD